ncbi:MAG: hypothetical protein WA799_07385 [Nitrosotalea sp.]
MVSRFDAIISLLETIRMCSKLPNQSESRGASKSAIGGLVKVQDSSPKDNSPLIVQEEIAGLDEFIGYLKKSENFTETDVVKIVKRLLTESAKDLLSDFTSEGHYVDVRSLSFEELNNIPDMADKKYSGIKGFFSRGKINRVEINGKEMRLFKLKLFYPIILYQIPQVNPKFLDPHRHKTLTCTCYGCHGSGTITRTVKRTSGYNHGHAVTETEQITERCNACNGSGRDSFAVALYFNRYEKGIDSLNKEIGEILVQASQKISEYNRLACKLNKKINIWNAKCPQNAEDKSKTSDKINQPLARLNEQSRRGEEIIKAVLSGNEEVVESLIKVN